MAFIKVFLTAILLLSFASVAVYGNVIPQKEASCFNVETLITQALSVDKCKNFTENDLIQQASPETIVDFFTQIVQNIFHLVEKQFKCLDKEFGINNGDNTTNIENLKKFVKTIANPEWQTELVDAVDVCGKETTEIKLQECLKKRLTEICSPAEPSTSLAP